MTSYRKELAASTRAVSRVVAWAEKAARRHPDLSQPTVNALLVCIQELVSNVALHAQHSEGSPTIKLALLICANRVGVNMEDNGQPFDPTIASACKIETDLASADLGGRGLRIVRHMARKMSYHRAGQWNCIRLDII